MTEDKKAKLERLNRDLGNVIRGTCNTIGCNNCSLQYGDNKCEATVLQGQILDIEMEDYNNGNK